jgi:hypothetical protein
MPRNRTLLDSRLGELIHAIQREESKLVGTEGWAAVRTIRESVEELLWSIRGQGDARNSHDHIQLADRIGRDWLHSRPAIALAVEQAQSAWDEQFIS